MKLKSIYDNGGKTLDRYTIVTTQRHRNRETNRWFYEYIGASENGLGVFMWGECVLGRHLGKKVELTDLSKELQNRIINVLT